MAETAVINGGGLEPAPAPVPKPEQAERPKFSWLKPHPVFVIVLVGPEEQPFGIQMDFLCDRSEHFRNQFAQNSGNNTMEHIVRLPDATVEVFGLTQCYLYTGVVITDKANVPSYEALVSLWRLGHQLGIDGLCDKTLEAMIECRRLTQRIPATPLLVQVWKDTPEGSSIRILLLSWAAEYMRSSDARADFAKSLPQEVLSELVVTMSSFENVPVAQPPANPMDYPPIDGPRKNVHYLEEGDENDALLKIKRGRPSGPVAGTMGLPSDPKSAMSRKAPRTSLPKPQRRRSSGMALLEGRTFTTAQKMNFCTDLLSRMLSGPGFWTRLVGPFKEPVDPSQDGVPDYFKKVTRPMDLGTIKTKMDRGEYTSDEEFLADVRQIFDNCFTYWKKGDPMWMAGEKLQKTFEDKYSNMNRWIAKMEGEEGE